jgi:putative oxidoreductase
MRNLFSTNPNNSAALIIRLFLGIVIFPHGAQKLLGWFGGYGFNGTMGFLTGGAHLPYILALLVILIEFFGALLLIVGFATRIAAFAMLVNFLGILFKAHINNGFFMNWASAPNKPEGFEFHLLVIGISLALLIVGGGRASIDAAIGRTTVRTNNRNTATA